MMLLESDIGATLIDNVLGGGGAANDRWQCYQQLSGLLPTVHRVATSGDHDFWIFAATSGDLLHIYISFATTIM
jgi:hypothetical protein